MQISYSLITFSYRSVLCHWNQSSINRFAVIVENIVIEFARCRLSKS